MRDNLRQPTTRVTAIINHSAFEDLPERMVRACQNESADTAEECKRQRDIARIWIEETRRGV